MDGDHSSSSALRSRVDALADDLGRLRRQIRARELPGLDYVEFLLMRLTEGLGLLDALVQPRASELVREGLSVQEALDVVDARDAELQRLVGG